MQPNDQVQFEEGASNTFASKAKMPNLNRLVVKMGIAKDYEGSNKALIVIAIVAALFAVGIYAYYVQGYNPFRAKSAPVDYSKYSPELQKFLQQNQTQSNSNQ